MKSYMELTPEMVVTHGTSADGYYAHSGVSDSLKEWEIGYTEYVSRLYRWVTDRFERIVTLGGVEGILLVISFPEGTDYAEIYGIAPGSSAVWLRMKAALIAGMVDYNVYLGMGTNLAYEGRSDDICVFFPIGSDYKAMDEVTRRSAAAIYQTGTRKPLMVNPELKDFTYYCSPLPGTSPLASSLNMAMALVACELLTERNMHGRSHLKTVISPHAFLPAVYHDGDPQFRRAAQEFGKALIRQSRGIYVGSHKMIVSTDMVGEITYAAKLGLPVEFDNRNLLKEFRVLHPELADAVKLAPIDIGVHAQPLPLFYTSLMDKSIGWYVDAGLKMARSAIVDSDNVLPAASLDKAYRLALEAAKGMR